MKDLKEKYPLTKGFGTTKEALDFLRTHGLSPDNFLVIAVEDQKYIVSIETLSHEIVIASDTCFLREGYTGVRTQLDTIDWENIWQFENPRISAPWDDKYMKELESIYRILILHTGRNCYKSYLKRDAIILLACFLNKTIS